ncbi:hypothetical protein K470DRAFT_222576 [Piedraia hortae CBS 480.64]|uniref:Uncharacterized protein n=1 Tax=Piedraia hortae CBS 480.64 TaxID=1314780 RepID=A0A6A7BRY8_9PEZI|nr:hypothetical protein K470DRAFT_222576 [Piedraia hortae CBS 480.64]
MPTAPQIYHLTTAAWLTLQSLPTLITPRLITTLLALEPRRSTDLEVYLSRSLGLTLAALAGMSIIVSGILTDQGDQPPVRTSQSVAATDVGTPPRTTGGNGISYPTALLTTAYFFSSTFYLYMQFVARMNFGFTMGLVLNACCFAFGVWILLFGWDKGHVSKRTGMDKRVGKFPFGEKKEKERDKDKEEGGRRRRKGLPKFK